MITALFDLLDFLRQNFAMLFALIFYTVLAISFSKSIKKHYKVYYWVFGLLSAGFIIPQIFRLCGATFPFELGKIPLLGPCFRELSSAANFIHPVLILIMYMGAFSPKNQYVGRLMSIRKELSIIVGFPVIAHAVKRLFSTFVGGWNFFFNHEAYLQKQQVPSLLGSGITNFVFVLGVVMLVLFLLLWITSFDSVHRKLGTKRWKSIQKWSYALYAMLFIHSMGLNLGGYISDKARAAEQITVVEARAAHAPHGNNPARTSEHRASSNREQSHSKQQPQQAGPSHSKQQPQQASHGHGKRPQSFKFTEIEIGKDVARVINMVILVLIYGSYLFFRLRKAKRSRANRIK